MATIEKQDFVQIEYTGKIKEGNIIFDTTKEDVAKKAEIHNPSMPYGEFIVCIGEGQILHGLETELIGNNIGEEYTINLSPENAFGKKDAKLLKLVPSTVFKKQGIQLQPGLQVNVDGAIGIVKTVSGGRVVVDFNHPLSGKEVSYEVRVNRKITDDKEKVIALVKMMLSTKDVKVQLDAGNISVKLGQEIPDEVVGIISSKIKSLIEGVKSVKISKSEPEKSTTGQA